MKTKPLSIVLLAALSMLLAGVGTSSARGNGALASATSPTASRPDTGSGSIVGRVRFEGQLPKPTHISMSADPSCVKLHPGSASNEDYVTGSGGTLGNVVVFVSDGVGNRTFDVPTEPVVVEQRGCMYQPHVLALRANQKLRMVNSDSTTHNVHPIPANNREWNKADPAGSTLEETFVERPNRFASWSLQ